MKSTISHLFRFAHFHCRSHVHPMRNNVISSSSQLKYLFRGLEGNSFLGSVSFSCWHCQTEYQTFCYFCPKCAKLQKPSPSVNFFELFNIQCSFEVNLENLTKQFRSIQAQLHPDKYSQKDCDEQNLSSDYSSLVNKAYSCLQNPLNRALYMLELKGITVEEEKTQMDKMFLMEIMELNEEIEAADPKKLLNLEKENQARLKELYLEFSKYYSDNDLNKAKELVLRIKYFVSMENRIKEINRKLLG